MKTLSATILKHVITAPILVLAVACWIDGAETPAHQALAAITAADQARSAEANEAAVMVKERLQAAAALSMLETQIELERQTISQLETERAALDQQLEQARHANDSSTELVAENILRAVDDQVTSIATLLPPGILPRVEKTGTATEQLLALEQRLTQALERTKTWQLGIEEGSLDGQTRAVHVLRCGAVAWWWRELGGTRAGIVRLHGDPLHGGILQCVDAATDQQRRAILQAMAIADGQRAPALTDLPLEVTP